MKKEEGKKRRRKKKKKNHYQPSRPITNQRCSRAQSLLLSSPFFIWQHLAGVSSEYSYIVILQRFKTNSLVFLSQVSKNQDMTFFSDAKYRFLPVPEDGRIETDSFLKACTEVVPFFDVLGRTAFAPVKSDINGNIKKLRGIYEKCPQKFRALQSIVDTEIQAKTTRAKNSGTDALLWLKRAMQFILVFLKQVLTGEQDLVKCANKAYEKTLKQYHNFIVKGIFNLAAKSVPYRKDFIQCLSKGSVDELTLLEEMQNFVDELDANIDVIQEYYNNNSLDI